MGIFVDKRLCEPEALSSVFAEFDEDASALFMDETADDLCDGRLLVNELSEPYHCDEDEWAQTKGLCATQDDWATAETEPPPRPSTPEEARCYLRLFFQGRSMHYGGPISESELLIDRHIDMVLRLELIDCVDIFYAALHEHGITKNHTQIETFFRLQQQAFRLSIPRHRSGGLLLVWLRLCRGWDV